MELSDTDRRQVLRRQLWAVLHDSRGRLGHAFSFFLIILILLSAAMVPLEFLPTYPRFSTSIHILEAIIVAFFTVEYVLRVYAAPNRLRYIFSFFGIVDLVSIMPFYAGIFGTEYVRILRFLRLFKLVEIEAGAQKDDETVMQKGIGLVPGEHMEHIVTKSPLALIFGVITPIVALTFAMGLLLIFGVHVIALALSIVLFIFALIFLWKAWLDFSYDVIYITNYRIILQNQHILGRSTNQVSYHAITNVKPFYPNVISYIFRYGTLVIDTAAEHPGQLSLHMVRRHEHAAHLIMHKCLEMKQTESASPSNTQGEAGADQYAPHP